MPRETFGYVKTPDGSMIFKNVRLYDGDLVIIKNSDVPQDQKIEFMEALQQVSRTKFMVIFVDDLNDVKSMTVKELEQIQEWAKESE